MNRTGGYTLIEMLIALTIFAILATITASVLYSTFNTRIRLNEASERFTSLQLALLLLRRDTQQIIDSNFVGKANYLEFIHLGYANLDSDKQSRVKRVAYLCQGSSLLKRTWQHNNVEDRVLLQGLSHCRFNYLDANHDSFASWKALFLPAAIAFQADLKKSGHIHFLFML